MVNQCCSTRAGARPPYRNAVLTGIALMLAMLVADRAGVAPGAAVAHATGGELQPHGGALVSAADQRKQIIAELARLNQAVTRLETTIARGIEVKVTDMPEMKARGEQAERNAPAERPQPQAGGAPEKP